MLSHKHKFVFVHIPKTAGTSITSVLAPYCEVPSNNNTTSPLYFHASAIELKNFFDKMNWNWDEYFKFTFVRNPWDRLVSYYEFMNQRYQALLNKNLLTNDLICKNFGETIISFDDFIYNLEKYTARTDAHYHSINNNPVLDYVGKVETIQSDFNHVCKEIDIPNIELPHKNKTKHKHYTEYYNDETKRIVAGKYADDISMFGHSFSKMKKQKRGFLKYRYNEYKSEQKQKRFNAYNARNSNS